MGKFHKSFRSAKIAKHRAQRKFGGKFYVQRFFGGFRVSRARNLTGRRR